MHRRNLLMASAALAAPATLSATRQPHSVRPKSSRRRLDFANPIDHLYAWMKLQTSLRAGSVWYWYRCRMDLAVLAKPIVSYCGYDSLYRYDVVPPREPDGNYQVTRWESCIYTDSRSNEPIDSIVDPQTGDRVRPFHFTEGPVDFRFGTRRRDGSDFLLRWTVAGDEAWVANDTYRDFPHPLPPARWPRASSGERLQFSNCSTLRGSLRELEDPALVSIPCRLSYQATSGALPWMQRGAIPGFVVWRGQGIKFATVAEVPETSRRAFERVHPEMFQPVPWSGKRLMFEEYARARGPEPTS